MSKPVEGRRDFETLELEIKESTKMTLSLLYPIYWEGLGVLKDAVALLINEVKETPGTEEAKFKTIQLMLVNRSIQHLETIRILMERGLYGDAFVIVRSIMSDLSMLIYLFSHPELRDLFLKETEDDYQKNPAFKDAFSEGTIERDIVAHGGKPAKKAFRILSKSSHASAFGSQLYGYRGKGNKYHFNYGPKLEIHKALMLAMTLSTGHYDFVVQLLAYQEELGNGELPEDWKNIAKAAAKLPITASAFDFAAKAVMKDYLSKNV